MRHRSYRAYMNPPHPKAIGGASFPDRKRKPYNLQAYSLFSQSSHPRSALRSSGEKRKHLGPGLRCRCRGSVDCSLSAEMEFGGGCKA